LELAPNTRLHLRTVWGVLRLLSIRTTSPWHRPWLPNQTLSTPCRRLMADVETLQALANLSAAEAHALLQSANGDIELAANMALSSRVTRTPVERLRELIGPDATDFTLDNILRLKGGNVDAAANHFFDNLHLYSSNRAPPSCAFFAKPMLARATHVRVVNARLNPLQGITAGARVQGRPEG
jgi:hypothetical protein